MSFLVFLMLAAIGFAGVQLWRIAQALIIISACVGFDEAKKAGMLEELTGDIRRELANAHAQSLGTPNTSKMSSPAA